MKKDRENSHLKGTSLLEVVLALGITAVVLVALARLATMAISNAAFARDKSIATQLAQQIIEEVRAFRDQNEWDDFKGECHPDPLEIPDEPTIVVTDPGSINSRFSLSRFECDCVTLDAGETCEVLAEVHWIRDERTHHSSLVTHFSNW